jgi:hypothetical protein
MEGGAGGETSILGMRRVGGACRTSFWAVTCQIRITIPVDTRPRTAVFRRQLLGRDHQPPTRQFVILLGWAINLLVS